MELFCYYFNISNIPNYLGYWGYIFHQAKYTFYLIDAFAIWFYASLTTPRIRLLFLQFSLNHINIAVPNRFVITLESNSVLITNLILLAFVECSLWHGYILRLLPFPQQTWLSQPPAVPPASSQQPRWTPCQTSDVSEGRECVTVMHVSKDEQKPRKAEVFTRETSSRMRPKVDALSFRSSLTCLDTSSLWVMSSPASKRACWKIYTH